MNEYIRKYGIADPCYPTNRIASPEIPTLSSANRTIHYFSTPKEVYEGHRVH